MSFNIVARDSSTPYVGMHDPTTTVVAPTTARADVTNAASVATPAEVAAVGKPKIAVPSRTPSTVPANARYISGRHRPVTMLLPVIALLCAGCSAEVFTNTFLVKMRQPAERHVADRVAVRNGFVNLGPVSCSAIILHLKATWEQSSGG